MDRVVATLGATGLLLSGVGLAAGRPRSVIEGAYYNRAYDAPPDNPVLAENGPGLLDPADGNLWLGAGLALTLVAALGAFPLERRP